MRLDKLLHCLRFAKTRGAAQRWIAEEHIRLNGERVSDQDRRVSVGDVLTLPLRNRVAVVRVLAIPTRRGPPVEAQACYHALDAGGTSTIAGGRVQAAPPERVLTRGSPPEKGSSPS